MVLCGLNESKCERVWKGGRGKTVQYARPTPLPRGHQPQSDRVCGMTRYGVVCCGIVWYDKEWCGMLSCGVEEHRTYIKYGIELQSDWGRGG